jgi:hypothetical protein
MLLPRQLPELRHARGRLAVKMPRGRLQQERLPLEPSPLRLPAQPSRLRGLLKARPLELQQGDLQVAAELPAWRQPLAA